MVALTNRTSPTSDEMTLLTLVVLPFLLAPVALHVYLLYARLWEFYCDNAHYSTESSSELEFENYSDDITEWDGESFNALEGAIKEAPLSPDEVKRISMIILNEEEQARPVWLDKTQGSEDQAAECCNEFSIYGPEVEISRYPDGSNDS